MGNQSLSGSGDIFDQSIDEEPKRSNEISLFFSTANGAKIPITMDPNHSVQSLKNKIIHVMRNHPFYEGTFNAQLEQGSKLELLIGGEKMKDVHPLSAYALVNGSVVHPRWGSVRSALELNDAFVWLDPDWYQEANNRNMRMTGDFLDLVYTAPGPTISRTLCPGPLVYPNGITERRTPIAGGIPAQHRQELQYPTAARAERAALATRGREDADAAAAAARRSDGLLVL
jgi:hypothetical protein